MASKQFSLELGLSNLNETGKSSNPSVSQVSETSKKDLEDLFHNFYDEYFDSSNIMKSSTTNVETSNVEIPSHKEEVFHESYESFQEESSSSSLNVQQSPEEVILPQTNTQSVSNNMVPNFDEASTLHNVLMNPHEKKWTKDHPLYKIIGDPKSSVHTRGQLANSCLSLCLLSAIEPVNVAEALKDADWVSAMKEELDQFARLKDFTVFQMDVKTTFLNGILKEDVYVGQPLHFISKQYPDHVYALDKALYGLKQAPRACSIEPANVAEALRDADWTAFLNRILKEEVYASQPPGFVSKQYPDHVYALDKALPDIMFVTCMCARYLANPNEHHVSAVKRIFRYLKGTINLVLWYLKDSGFDLTAYSDADHAGCHLDRKGTSGSVKFLGDKLVCWSSKKQNCVSISTAESEYVAVSSCCAQVLWMRTQLTYYGFFYDKVLIYYDSKSAIAILCNPVQHTHIKHIDVMYHFIKDHDEKETIELYFVGTEYQLADLFTKSLPEARFKFLVEKLGMMSREI
nr:retrovirus-related Pol polyprotein from transposon TNT 1-94 [Tanacetum cinerariifolium]